MNPTETDLEPLLVEALRIKAEQLPDVVEPFDPNIAVMDIEERPRRSRHLVAAAAVLVVFIAVAGLVVALRGNDGAVSPSQEAQTPVAHLSIESTPELTFQAKTYTTSPGLNEIDFTSAGGTHTLKFDDPALADFSLTAAQESPSHGEVRLEAGRDYTIFCGLPGHREAGEVAVIHVTSGTSPTKGTMPAARSDGSVDPTQVPDFISTLDRSGHIVGYLKREALLDPSHDNTPVTVYGDDLKTVVGHMYPGRGFVPVGQNAPTVPLLPSSTTATTAPR